MNASAVSEPNGKRALLELKGVSKTFGALKASNDVSLTVWEGERRALIGPNGAGKSTLFKLITGQLLPSEGNIVFDGVDVSKAPAHERAKLGMAMTFQHSNLLAELTVRENVTLAVQRKLGVARKWFAPISAQKSVHARTDELIEEMGLAEHANRAAADLAYGMQRRVEVALAYATEPRLLLLDEPAAGMSPGEIEDFLEVLLGIPGLTFILVEHNIDVVMRVASSITVLDAGSIIAEGNPEAVTASEAVQRAYLGSSLGEDVFE
jgi:branched-chain amino acid transport system ATP-binding protein